MADDSPGKVQALRAMFAEKDNPLIGIKPSCGNIPYIAWNVPTSTPSTFKERIIRDQKSSSQLITKVLPDSTTEQMLKTSKTDILQKMNPNGSNLHRVSAPVKPQVGPKPFHLSQMNNNLKNSSSDKSNSISSKAPGSCQNVLHSKSKAVAETIATFMFTNGISAHKEKESTTDNSSGSAYGKISTNASNATSNSEINSQNVVNNIGSVNNSTSVVGHPSEIITACEQFLSKNTSDSSNKFDDSNNPSTVTNKLPSDEDTNLNQNCPPIPKPRILANRSNLHKNVEFRNMRNTEKTLPKKDSSILCSSMINADNYVCKSNCNFKRKPLPPVEILGPPPLKPVRPSHVGLPQKFRSLTSTVQVQNIEMQTQKSVIQKPAYPCPPRPQASPPLPPTKPQMSLLEEIEEMYGDTLLVEGKRPVSLIPELTAEEEEAETEELYNDADEPLPQLPLKPKLPPPPPPSEYSPPNLLPAFNAEELYQDADEVIDEEFYEVMPNEESQEELEDLDSPVYGNNKKELDKLKREDEKRTKKEQKEKEKREKEMEKLRKKFSLTGEEIPIDEGLVKSDSRGGKGDLTVKKGESVLILRMEGNPIGRWLVKNERGKIGYVELRNIEVDAVSVKSVMTIRRLSVIDVNEELYNEAKSEEEGIYEITY